MRELIKYYSTSCGPCKMLKPTIEKLKDEGFKVTEINLTEEPEKNKHNVMTVPTCVVLCDGALIETIIGLQPYPKYKAALVD